MAGWQKRARIMVAVFGLARAVLVFLAIGPRPPLPEPPCPVVRGGGPAVLSFFPAARAG